MNTPTNMPPLIVVVLPPNSHPGISQKPSYRVYDSEKKRKRFFDMSCDNDN